MKNCFSLLPLLACIWACSPRIACPDPASTYESTREQRPKFGKPTAEKSFQEVKLVSIERSYVPLLQPQIAIPAINQQLELIKIDTLEEVDENKTSLLSRSDTQVIQADTTIVPWTEEDLEEIKRAQKRGRSSLLIALLFPVASLIPIVNLIAIPMAIGGLILGTKSLKTFKKYKLKKAKGKLAAVLGTVINWAWVILSIAVVLILLWYLIAWSQQ